MYCTEVMQSEHDNILSFLDVVRAMCCHVLETKEVDTGDFRKVIDFARNYSDHQHHGKEEKFLFNEMEARLGAMGQNLIRHGMLVEHDLCRGHILDLEAALDLYDAHPDKTVYVLDILEAAEGYATLLTRHIKKENTVVYPFAERSLPAEVVSEINRKVEDFEKETEKQGIQQHYLALRDELKAKYGTVEDQHDLAAAAPLPAGLHKKA